MVLLVTGAREWKNHKFIWDVLDLYKKAYGLKLFLVEGGARGVDTHAHNWAKNRGIDRARFPANWEGRKKSGGPIRNRKMFRMAKPDRVLAFHHDLYNGSTGTRDMVRFAKDEGCPVVILTGKEKACDLSVL